MIKDLAYNLGGFIHLLTWKDFVIMILVFLVLVLLLIIYYMIKVKEEIPVKEAKEERKLDLDLKQISKKIEAEEPRTIQLTDYEEEQESKAIISYQELLEKSKEIRFEDIDDEYQNFEVKIKKINLESEPKIKEEPIKRKEEPKVKMMSYEHENDFLDALKKLQSELTK